MAETPAGKGGKTTTKTGKARKSSKCYCILCRRIYWKNGSHEHMHSMLHHRELEIVLGSGPFHECQACKTSAMDLREYATHISTGQHRVKMNKLKCKKSVKPISLEKSLSQEIISKILERNKTLKKEIKKANKKKQKKNKQEANLKNLQKQQNKEKQQMQQTSPQEQYNVQPTQPPPKGCIKGLVKNKENRLAGRTRQRCTRSGETLTQQPQFQTLPSHLAYQPKPDYSSFRFNRSDYRNLRNEGPMGQQGEFVYPVPSHTNNNNKYWDDYNSRYSSATVGEFTSDQLPRNGAIIFGKGQDGSQESTRPDPGQDPCRTPAPPTASTLKLEDRSSDAGTIRDSDVTAMLREIRRTLGLREPCRADREARSLRQSSEACMQSEARSSMAQTRTEKDNSPGSSLSDKQTQPVSRFHVPSTSSQKCSVNNQSDRSTAKLASFRSQQVKLEATPTLPKQRTPKKTGEKVSRSQVSLQNAPQSDALTGHKERESQGGSVPRLGSLAQLTTLSRNKAKTTAAEPNLNAARRIRNVGETRKAEGEKEVGLKPTIQKLLCSAGSQRKVNWKEMYQEAHRKKLEKVKGQPRFGIELVNPLPEHDGFPHVEDEEDPPLSEGFQWECDLPGTPPPPPAPCPTATDSTPLRRSETRTQVTEQPEGDGSELQTAAGVSVKKEMLAAEGQDGCPGGNYGSELNVKMTKKRKADAEMSPASSLDPSVKKRKSKSKNDQTQVDQLLAVSLKEEALNQSLMEVDTSLIQARNALQLAYTEVQRLLLLKQQFTNEVNSLRAQRIEILQGMQVGYTGAPVGAADTLPHRPLPVSLPSPNATPSTKSPAATTSTSVNQPNPNSSLQSKLLIKQESFERSTERPASEPSKALIHNDTARQSPGNHVVQTAAAIPLATLLLTPSHSTRAVVSPAVALSPSVQMADRSTSPRPPIDPANKQWKQELVCSPPVTPQGGQEQLVVAQDTDEGEDSDSSLEMVVRTSDANLEVIDLDDSDSESLSEVSPSVCARPVPSPKPAGVEVTFADPQQCSTESKFGILTVSPKNVNIPPGPAEDDDPSTGSFQGHNGPVHGLQVHKGLLYTCSGDYTARAYCLQSKELRAVFEGHTSKINCLLVSSPVNMLARLYTGSSDQTIRCYSIKSKKCLETISLPDRVLCLHIGWTILYVGLANGSVISFDLKNLKQLDVFECHGPRGVSCLGTAQEGARRVLLVGSYDSTISVRDAKSGLLLRTLEGHTKTVLCMKVVNDLVFSGSSDTSVHAHNIHTGELVRIYKGHNQAVTSVAILGKVMVTACLDKLVRVYELQSHDRLQVYGGHSEMVMCMAIHKSVIYTGCYDGSIQAVKLNLMKNHRCWWHGCCLIFGMAEHLCQHLLRDHTNANQNNVKCRWRGCDSFFAKRDAVRLEMPEHMLKHAEDDSVVEN